MSFADRQSAGCQLADKLVQYFHGCGLDTGHNLVIAGLPRGGVPVALEVARRLRHPLDIMVSKKLPYPGQPEFAIGAVSSDGEVVLNSAIPETLEWQNYVERERKRLLKQTFDAENQIYQQSGRQRTTFKGKVVIVIDDGVATGLTAIAALKSARYRGADTVIAAAPVMSPESYQDLGKYCDGVVACDVPEIFQAVGLHYENFLQTTDKEVVEALRESAQFSTSNSADLKNVLKSK
jgi:putative phosphoribosyl transferase